MAKVKRFSEVWRDERVNEEITMDAATVSAVVAALGGVGITAAVIKDVTNFMKEKNYSGIDGFIRALKEWRDSKKGDDVASKF